MLPISQTFNVSLVDVTAVPAIALWMRLVGATLSGWLADRMGRKKPLMISIAWYSVANLLAGLAPSFGLLFLFRALMGIGMGAEWPVGAALAMEQWPIRSARLHVRRAARLPWGIGALLSSAAYGLLYNYIGWRGLLIIGVLPALAILYVRRYVKEPEVWLENRRRQRAEKREVKVPLFQHLRRVGEISVPPENSSGEGTAPEPSVTKLALRLDHCVAFLIAIVLWARRLGPVIKIVTAFHGRAFADLVARRSRYRQNSERDHRAGDCGVDRVCRGREFSVARCR